MGILQYLKGILPKQKDKIAQYAAWQSNSQPLFNCYGKDVYLCDMVNNAISRIAEEMGKIEIRSVLEKGDQVRLLNDDITRVFRFRPNPLQTTKDYLECVEWLRRKNGIAFVYPCYEIVKSATGQTFKRYTAFYPLNPQNYAIGTDATGQIWQVELQFADGYKTTLPYSELLAFKWRRGTNTIVGGGDDNGNMSSKDLLQTVSAIGKIIDGMPKAIEASMQMRGVLTATTLKDADHLKKIRDELEERFMTSKLGITATDIVGNFVPFNFNPVNISKEVLEFLKSVVCERYGVSIAILSGNYTGDEHAAFYQTAIEPNVLELQQVMTSGLFTQREIDVGHVVKGYYNKVAYMSTKDKLELADLATKTRLMTLNQIADMFGAPPWEDGNVRIQSLNYVEESIANQYQLQNKKADRKKEDGDEGNEP